MTAPALYYSDCPVSEAGKYFRQREKEESSYSALNEKKEGRHFFFILIQIMRKGMRKMTGWCGIGMVAAGKAIV